jgi:hypothetical protein
MWREADVEIRRELDPAGIGPFEYADARNGILLNHEYIDMRGQSIADARLLVDHEAEMLREMASASEDDIGELIDDFHLSEFELAMFDIGTGGCVYALSAAGAAPISSCNGGLLEGAQHASDVPHILFSIDPDLLGPILAAAKAADIGLINNDGHIEVFARRLPDLNTFADRLLTELENGRGCD